MGWFGKKKAKNTSIEEVKCQGCEKKINASECIKSTDGKCWCKDCSAKQEKK